MIRLVLSFSISSILLAVGLAVAWTQSRNYALAADLDEMQEECEWYERRIGGLREQLERFEFELCTRQNRLDDPVPPRGGPTGEQ